MRGHKANILGNDECIIMSPRGAYIQESSLSTYWRHCKIGMFYTIINTSDDDALNTNETVGYSNQPDKFMFGLSNGTGSMGGTGNKFTGITSDLSSVATTLNPFGGNSMTTLDTTCHGVWANGATILSTSTGNSPSAGYAPGGAGFIGLDLSCRYVYEVGEFIDISFQVDSSSNVSLTSLRNKLVTLPYKATAVSHKYATTSGADIGVRHFFARAPYLNNRLRIHAIEVLQLA